MHKERLLVLAGFLDDKVSPTEFTMGSWGEEHDCGTVACAFGWATQIPQLQSEGLSCERHENLIGIVNWTPVFNGERGYKAAMAFFELTREQASYLFEACCYATRVATGTYRMKEFVSPKDVATRIRTFVFSGGDTCHMAA